MTEYSEIARLEQEAIELAKAGKSKSQVDKAVISMNVKCRQVMCKESRVILGNAYKESNYFIK